MSRRALAQRGYTAVELLMAISIFGIGVAGIISMEKVTSVTNAHAKNLAIATHIAESWLDMLSLDGSAWTAPSTNTYATGFYGNTTWLKKTISNANTANNWFLPDYSPTLLFGPAFDALGDPVNPTGTTPIAFCAHLRLSWLYQPTNNGNGLIRAEVRVFWLREGQTFGQNMCTTGQVAAVGAATQSFHFVQKITAIRENNP